MNTHNVDIHALSKMEKKGKESARYQNYILLYSRIEKQAMADVRILVY